MRIMAALPLIALLSLLSLSSLSSPALRESCADTGQMFCESSKVLMPHCSTVGCLSGPEARCTGVDEDHECAYDPGDPDFSPTVFRVCCAARHPQCAAPAGAEITVLCYWSCVGGYLQAGETPGAAKFWCDYYATLGLVANSTPCAEVQSFAEEDYCDGDGSVAASSSSSSSLSSRWRSSSGSAVSPATCLAPAPALALLLLLLLAHA